jgi:hypothetical protein
VLASSVVRINNSGVTANAKWSGNVQICGTTATGAEPWPDLDQTGCANLAAIMPPGDIYPTGATKSAREQASGLMGAATNDFTCTPTRANSCVAGANLQGLKSELGIVSNINVRVGASALQFDYVAPDARRCSVDTSADGASWTRTTDSGGARPRRITVSGLNSATNYQYRVMCYYDQTDPWFSYPSESTSMATNGMKTTAPAGSHDLAVRFRIPAQAATALVTVTGIGSAPVSQSCGASPCTVANVPLGAAQMSIAYLSSGGAPVSSGTFFIQ